MSKIFSLMLRTRRIIHTINYKDPFYLVIGIVALYIIIFLYTPLLVSISRIISQGISIDIVSSSLPVLWRSFKVAIISTLISVAVAIPISYSLSFYLREKEKIIISVLIIAPYWVGTLLKMYSLAYLLYILEGITGQRILYTETSIYLGMVYNYTPMAIIPIFLAMERIDRIYIDSAKTLGAKTLDLVFRVILPISYPGLIAGFVLVFTSSLGEMIVPQVLGGSPRYMIGQWIYELTFTFKRFGDASLLSLLYLILTLIVVWYVTKKFGSREIIL
ncbi:MAG: ABC transporter permease [Sulfolobales archaeon]